MINNSLIYLSLLISGCLLTFLCFFPELDLMFSRLFYDSVKGFIYKQNIIVKLIYFSIPFITKFFIAILLIYLIYMSIKCKSFKVLYKSTICYLILAALIGPGIIVNSSLKNYHGRARPAQVVEFGGNKNFTIAILPSDSCSSNCSFPSGHAAMAFYFTSLAYALGNVRDRFNKIYIAALLFGILVGISRILMGGHFLSDVAASCFIILIFNHIIYLLWRRYV